MGQEKALTETKLSTGGLIYLAGKEDFFFNLFTFQREERKTEFGT